MPHLDSIGSRAGFSLFNRSELFFSSCTLVLIELIFTPPPPPPLADILESFETQHPLVLPDAGYQFQLGKEVTDSTLWEERDKLTKFISTLSQSGEVTTTQEQKVLTMENVSLQEFVKKKKEIFS